MAHNGGADGEKTALNSNLGENRGENGTDGGADGEKKTTPQTAQNSDKKLYEMSVFGAVQGVGFRPFVWGLAHELGAHGYVLNDGEGVKIALFAGAGEVAAFAAALREKLPPLAAIDELTTRCYGDFAAFCASDKGREIFALCGGANGEKTAPNSNLCAGGGALARADGGAAADLRGADFVANSNLNENCDKNADIAPSLQASAKREARQFTSNSNLDEKPTQNSTTNSAQKTSQNSNQNSEKTARNSNLGENLTQTLRDCHANAGANSCNDGGAGANSNLCVGGGAFARADDGAGADLRGADFVANLNLNKTAANAQTKVTAAPATQIPAAQTNPAANAKSALTPAPADICAALAWLKTDFRILCSNDSQKLAPILPDFALCDDCAREFADPRERRHRHLFINCTNCGPRFSIIRALPYDRANTTMAGFAMCPECAREYADPSNRRYHAQPIACKSCGPVARFLSKNGGGFGGANGANGANGENSADVADVADVAGANSNLGENCADLTANFAAQNGAKSRADGDFVEVAGDVAVLAAAALARGEILAVKGMGGFHLMCDASSEAAVSELRRRKRRPHKPFAVMAQNPAAARAIGAFSEDEFALLTSQIKPIVLVKKADLGGDFAADLGEKSVNLGENLREKSANSASNFAQNPAQNVPNSNLSADGEKSSANSSANLAKTAPEIAPEIAPKTAPKTAPANQPKTQPAPATSAITAAPQNRPLTLAPSVAPCLDEVGVFLPSTSLQMAILDEFAALRGGAAAVVATSANISGEPILTNFAQVREKLAAVVDAAVDFNREIANASDDSVGLCVGGRVVWVRASRGLKPRIFRIDLAGRGGENDGENDGENGADLARNVAKNGANVAGNGADLAQNLLQNLTQNHAQTAQNHAQNGRKNGANHAPNLAPNSNLNNQTAQNLAPNSNLSVAADENLAQNPAQNLAPKSTPPAPKFPAKKATFIALGSELKNTFALYKDGLVALSAYIGDLKNPATLRRFAAARAMFEHAYEAQAAFAVGDLHPHFWLAREWERGGARAARLAHHKAHAVSAAWDGGVVGGFVALAWDGTGYGEDGRVWGGEAFAGWMPRAAGEAVGAAVGGAVGAENSAENRRENGAESAAVGGEKNGTKNAPNLNSNAVNAQSLRIGAACEAWQSSANSNLGEKPAQSPRPCPDPASANSCNDGGAGANSNLDVGGGAQNLSSKPNLKDKNAKFSRENGAAAGAFPRADGAFSPRKIALFRVASFCEFGLIGGDSAVKKPALTAYALLRAAGVAAGEAHGVLARLGLALPAAAALEAGLARAPRTSSVGRIFDGFGAIALGVGEASFDAQLPMWLGALYDERLDVSYDFAPQFVPESAPRGAGGFGGFGGGGADAANSNLGGAGVGNGGEKIVRISFANALKSALADALGGAPRRVATGLINGLADTAFCLAVAAQSGWLARQNGGENGWDLRDDLRKNCENLGGKFAEILRENGLDFNENWRENGANSSENWRENGANSSENWRENGATFAEILRKNAATTPQNLAQISRQNPAQFAQSAPKIPLVLSGGVWQNRHLLARVLRLCAGAGIPVVTPRNEANNDENIALGQLIWAYHNVI